MIVVDASWVVALRDPQDEHHSRAVKTNRETAGEERCFIRSLSQSAWSLQRGSGCWSVRLLRFAPLSRSLLPL